MDITSHRSHEFLLDVYPHMYGEYIQGGTLSVELYDYPQAEHLPWSFAVAEALHCAGEHEDVWDIMKAYADSEEIAEPPQMTTADNVLRSQARDDLERLVPALRNNRSFAECVSTRRYRWVVDDGYIEAANRYHQDPVLTIADRHYQGVRSTDEVDAIIDRAIADP